MEKIPNDVLDNLFQYFKHPLAYKQLSMVNKNFNNITKKWFNHSNKYPLWFKLLGNLTKKHKWNLYYLISNEIFNVKSLKDNNDKEIVHNLLKFEKDNKLRLPIFYKMVYYFSKFNYSELLYKNRDIVYELERIKSRIDFYKANNQKLWGEFGSIYLGMGHYSNICFILQTGEMFKENAGGSDGWAQEASFINLLNKKYNELTINTTTQIISYIKRIDKFGY